MDSNRTPSRWSDDAFLDRLRLEADAAADDCFAEIARSGTNFSGLFGFLNSDHSPVPDTAPAPLKAFFDTWLRTPTPDGVEVDWQRLERGEDAFMTHAACSALVLLVKSLPSGYAAPNLSKILVLSGELEHHPYKRLLGTLQMVINVTAKGGFKPSGRAIVTAPKLRLLHAGVRHIVGRHLPDYRSQYGAPVNHEDMLATIMGFSLLVVRGLQELRSGLGQQDAEDYFYLWRVYALAMGIHPKGEPDSTEYLPANLAEAQEFYDTYARRHYRPADENPEGVELTRANLLMLQHLLARTPLRWAGASLVPRIYMQQLLGADGLVQRGVAPVAWHPLTSRLVLAIPRAWIWLWARADQHGARHFHERFSQACFQRLIDRSPDGQVTFLIPDSLEDLHELTDQVVRPLGERRRAPRRLRQVDIARPDRRGGGDRRLDFRQTFWAGSGR